MRSTREVAGRKQVDSELEAIQFGLAEISAIIHELIPILARLQGRALPKPLPALDKRRQTKVAGTDWLSMTQAAQLVGVNLNTIWRWCNHHGLPFTRPGGKGRPRIRRSALQAFIER
jgi:excisionase family DNA binding protein